jgi:hypothetical protein
LSGEQRQVRERLGLVSRPRRTQGVKQRVKERRRVAEPRKDHPLLLSSPRQAPKLGHLRLREEALDGHCLLEAGQLDHDLEERPTLRGRDAISERTGSERPARRATRKVQSQPLDLGPSPFAGAKDVLLDEMRHLGVLYSTAAVTAV